MGIEAWNCLSIWWYWSIHQGQTHRSKHPTDTIWSLPCVPKFTTRSPQSSMPWFHFSNLPTYAISRTQFSAYLSFGTFSHTIAVLVIVCLHLHLSVFFTQSWHILTKTTEFFVHHSLFSHPNPTHHLPFPSPLPFSSQRKTMVKDVVSRDFTINLHKRLHAMYVN